MDTVAVNEKLLRKIKLSKSIKSYYDNQNF